MIIIIGSSKGLGKSIHKMFADKRLLLVSRTSTKVESENHFHIECDINNFDYSKIGKILEDEEIEAIFYTVGLSLIEDRFNISDEDKEKIINTNFLSIVKINEFFLKNCNLKSSSLICFCSSVTTFLPRSKQVLYCAAKSALNSYFNSLRSYADLEKKSFRVANLILGFMDTNMNKKFNTILPKKNPDQIAIYLKKNLNKLNGIYYVPFYWFFIKIILNLIPFNIKKFFFNRFNI